MGEFCVEGYRNRSMVSLDNSSFGGWICKLTKYSGLILICSLSEDGKDDNKDEHIR